MKYSQHKIKLHESEYEADVNIYEDELTGDQYIFDGEKFIKVKEGVTEPITGRLEEVDPNDIAIEETEEEEAERLGDLTNSLNDENTKRGIERDNEYAIQREQRVKAAKRASTRGSDSLEDFKLSLEHFVKNQIQDVKYNSWKRFNKKYHNSGLIKPGRAKMSSGHIPKINVYVDQSSSWDNDDVILSEQALSSLDRYVDRGEISIDVYYFATNIYDDAARARADGGTLQPVVVEHIIQTNPDNVIIMTDWDDWDSTEHRWGPVATVPGAVWFLWKQGKVSHPLMQHVSGRQLTQSFKLTS